MQKSISKIGFICFSIIILFVLFSCMSGIAEIKKDPYRYNGQEVNIYGTVEKVKLFNESSEYNAPVPLLLYTIKDNFDEIAVLSTQTAYKGSYKSVHGKVLIFKSNLYENDIQFIVNEITKYLSEKNALPSSKQKEAQKAFVSIIAAIINLLTNGKLSQPVNNISEGAQTIIDSNLDAVDKEYINQITNSLLNFLPKDEYYYLILED
jgi:hypothetical protein